MTIRNVLSAIHLVAREINVPRARVDARYLWTWLEHAHRDCVVDCVARVVGVPRDAVLHPHTRDELMPLAESFPLLASSASAPADHLQWHQVIDDVECGAERFSAMPSTIDRSAGAAFRSLIDGATCGRHVDELVAHVQARIVLPYCDNGAESVSCTPFRSLPTAARLPLPGLQRADCGRQTAERFTHDGGSRRLSADAGTVGSFRTGAVPVCQCRCTSATQMSLWRSWMGK